MQTGKRAPFALAQPVVAAEPVARQAVASPTAVAPVVAETPVVVMQHATPPEPPLGTGTALAIRTAPAGEAFGKLSQAVTIFDSQLDYPLRSFTKPFVWTDIWGAPGIVGAVVALGTTLTTVATPSVALATVGAGVLGSIAAKLLAPSAERRAAKRTTTLLQDEQQAKIKELETAKADFKSDAGEVVVAPEVVSALAQRAETYRKKLDEHGVNDPELATILERFSAESTGIGADDKARGDRWLELATALRKGDCGSIKADWIGKFKALPENERRELGPVILGMLFRGEEPPYYSSFNDHMAIYGLLTADIERPQPIAPTADELAAPVARAETIEVLETLAAFKKLVGANTMGRRLPPPAMEAALAYANAPERTAVERALIAVDAQRTIEFMNTREVYGFAQREILAQISALGTVQPKEATAQAKQIVALVDRLTEFKTQTVHHQDVAWQSLSLDQVIAMLQLTTLHLRQS